MIRATVVFVREVSCKATRMILEALDASGVAVAGLADGLPISLEELRDPQARVDWDVFTEVVERVGARCGDELPLEEIGTRILRVPSFDVLRHAGRLVVSPRQLYEVAVRLVAPALFPNVAVEQEWLGSGRLVITARLLPEYRGSVAFFRLCHGNVAALPRVLDLPASVIEEQAFSPRSGRLVLRPPPSHTLAVRVVRGVRALGTLGEAWRGVVRQQRELEASIEALRDSRHELEQLLERLPDGVLIHRSGAIRWANAAMVEMLGVPSVEDVVGRHVLDFVPPEDREPLAVAMRRAAPNEVARERRDYRVLRPDGTLRRAQAGTAQLVDFQGEPARMVVLRDVTEHHRLREQAAISDRLASIGALAAGVAHEINNPLAYVRLSLEMASRQAAAREGSDLHTSLQLAREGTERVINIVRDLKTLSRVRDEASEPVDLPALLDSTFALAERTVTAKARVVKSYAPTPLALGTRGKLGQVFINLLSNAADAVPEGAPSDHVIHVTTRTDSSGRAVVEISDTGCGIAPDIAHRVFDPFFTTKPAGVGTGLGLAMCHRIVTELGGEIAFESTQGTTTFRVTLPPAPEVAVVASGPAVVAPSPRPRSRVLVVDDEQALVGSISRLMADAHDVVGAQSAQRALEILADGDRFDAVLADVMMTEFTGVDLYEAVRKSRPGLERRFVFMTGGVLSEHVRSFLQAVPNRCLAKPFGRSELLEALEAAVVL
jgi:two-component system cell cycle sensor histidine kinase/response regulator CckA